MELVSIEDNTRLTKIDCGIFVKKDFISKEEYNSLLNKASLLEEDQWYTHPTDEEESGRISTNMNETFAVSQQVIDYVIPKYWINEHKTVNRMRPEDKPLTFGWNDWGSADYNVVFYFGDFTGGNLKCYKHGDEENFTILEIETNVLYLLPITNQERYISEPVESGIKYSFVDWIYKHNDWSFA